MSCILLVDDSLFQRVNMRNLLAPGGYTFYEAEDGETALRMILRHPIACILLDLVMPGMDGFEVLQLLHQQNIHIPTVVVSADTQVATLQRCHALGARAMVHKPLTCECGLLRTVQQILCDNPICHPARAETDSNWMRLPLALDAVNL